LFFSANQISAENQKSCEEEKAIRVSLLALVLYQTFAREVLCICDQDGSELLCMIDYYTKQHMNMHTATYTKGIQMSELQ
jgi:hypothetical protein